MDYLTPAALLHPSYLRCVLILSSKVTWARFVKSSVRRAQSRHTGDTRICKVSLSHATWRCVNQRRFPRSHKLNSRWRWMVHLHAPAALPPGKRPVTQCTGGWVGPRGTGRVRKISPPPGFDFRTVQPVVSRYTDWAIPKQYVAF